MKQFRVLAVTDRYKRPSDGSWRAKLHLECGCAVDRRCNLGGTRKKAVCDNHIQ